MDPSAVATRRPALRRLGPALRLPPRTIQPGAEAPAENHPAPCRHPPRILRPGAGSRRGGCRACRRWPAGVARREAAGLDVAGATVVEPDDGPPEGARPRARLTVPGRQCPADGAR